MLVNLLTGTANRGNLPSCSCVLRETLETVEISLTLFSSWLWWQKQLGHSGRRRWGRVRCFSITLPHQSRSSPLKRAVEKKKKKLVVPKLDQVCGNQYCCLHEGPPLRLFHIPPYIHSFWGERKKKTQPLNFRTVWTIDFTVTILTLSLPISVLSLFHSPPLTWNSFPPTSVKWKLFIIRLLATKRSLASHFYIFHISPKRNAFSIDNTNRSICKVKQKSYFLTKVNTTALTLYTFEILKGGPHRVTSNGTP